MNSLKSKMQKGREQAFIADFVRRSISVTAVLATAFGIHDAVGIAACVITIHFFIVSDGIEAPCRPHKRVVDWSSRPRSPRDGHSRSGHPRPQVLRPQIDRPPTRRRHQNGSEEKNPMPK